MPSPLAVGPPQVLRTVLSNRLARVQGFLFRAAFLRRVPLFSRLISENLLLCIAHSAILSSSKFLTASLALQWRSILTTALHKVYFQVCTSSQYCTVQHCYFYVLCWGLSRSSLPSLPPVHYCWHAGSLTVENCLCLCVCLAVQGLTCDRLWHMDKRVCVHSLPSRACLCVCHPVQGLCAIRCRGCVRLVQGSTSYRLFPSRPCLSVPGLPDCVCVCALRCRG